MPKLASLDHRGALAVLVIQAGMIELFAPSI
jgi:hypothetical protein